MVVLRADKKEFARGVMLATEMAVPKVALMVVRKAGQRDVLKVDD